MTTARSVVIGKAMGRRTRPATAVLTPKDHAALGTSAPPELAGVPGRRRFGDVVDRADGLSLAGGPAIVRLRRTTAGGD